MLGSHSVVIRPLSLLGKQDLWGIKGPCRACVRKAWGPPFPEGIEITMALLVVSPCGQCAMHLGRVSAASQVSVVPVNNGESLCISLPLSKPLRYLHRALLLDLARDQAST